MSATNDARDGGRLDFQEVYAEFHPRIQRYLARLLGPNEAEDAAQEVFAKVSRALAEFRADSSLSTWIYRIATNTAYDKLRSPSFKRSDEVPLDDATPVEEPSAGIDETLVQTEMNDCIGEYVDRLPASYRSVVVLSEHEGLTNQEIAETLNVSVDTVKIRLHRARARLKKELGNGCDFYRDGRNEFACQPKPDSPLRLGDPLVPRVAVPDHAHAATSSGREPGRHDEQPEADQHPGHREDPPGRTPQ